MSNHSRWLAMLVSAAAMCVLPQVASAQGRPAGTIVDFISNLDAIQSGLCRQPEGIAIDPSGNVYISSNSDQATTVEYVCVFNPGGKFREAIPVHAGPGPFTPGVTQLVGLLGEMWDGDWLYVLDQADNAPGNGRILKINLSTHAVVTISHPGDGLRFPNTIIQDSHGNRYVSDSFTATIYKIPPDDSGVSPWCSSPLFFSNNPSVQPVGLNDMAIDREEKYIYVGVTENRQVYRVALDSKGDSCAPELFADGAALDAQMGYSAPTALFGADGVQFDVMGNLYVCANQAEEIQVLSPEGKLIHRYAGAGANAMDFPASIAFRGHKLFITNMQADYQLPHSKVSIMQAPYAGLPLPLPDGR